MRIRSDRTYEYPVGRAVLWSALSGVADYPRWWPWLHDLRARALCAGEVWSCVVCPPLPYRLRLQIRLEEVVPEAFVAASVDGDVVGTASVELGERPGGCAVHLVSDLAPDHRLLRGFARCARPLVSYGHDWVLDTGARQLDQHLSDDCQTAGRSPSTSQ